MRLRRLLRPALVLLALAAAGYAAWSQWDRQPPRDPVELKLLPAASFGRDSGNGNLLGIQPPMVPSDYASADRFYRKLDGYFATARGSVYLRRNTVVVLQ